MLEKIAKQKKIIKMIVWSFTVIWMATIFYFSSQPSEVSLNSSGKILVTIDKLEEDEVQNISDRRVWNLQNTIRKYAHFIVYSALGFLMALSFVFIKHKNFMMYIYAWLSAALYGVLDEFHQHFIPGRGMTLSDMKLDALSALFGTVIAVLVIEGAKWIYLKRERKAIQEGS